MFDLWLLVACFGTVGCSLLFCWVLGFVGFGVLVYVFCLMVVVVIDVGYVDVCCGLVVCCLSFLRV